MVAKSLWDKIEINGTMGFLSSKYNLDDFKPHLQD